MLSSFFVQLVGLGDNDLRGSSIEPNLTRHADLLTAERLLGRSEFGAIRAKNHCREQSIRVTPIEIEEGRRAEG